MRMILKSRVGLSSLVLIKSKVIYFFDSGFFLFNKVYYKRNKEREIIFTLYFFKYLPSVGLDQFLSYGLFT
jgi:hypothetical protein